MSFSGSFLCALLVLGFSLEAWTMSDYLTCRKDYLQHCKLPWSTVEQEDYACLQGTFATIAIECQALVIRKTKDKCLKDAIKLCPGETVNVGSRFKCLSPQMDKVSSGCQEQLKLHVKLDSEQAIVCAQDYEKHCPAAQKVGLDGCLYFAYSDNLLSSDCVKFLSIRFPPLHNDFPWIRK